MSTMLSFFITLSLKLANYRLSVEMQRCENMSFRGSSGAVGISVVTWEIATSLRSSQ